VADRIGTIFEDREELVPTQGERLSYRASLLITLAASAALYGAAYFVLKGLIHLVRTIVGL
jgi:hypothetical protein